MGQPLHTSHQSDRIIYPVRSHIINHSIKHLMPKKFVFLCREGTDKGDLVHVTRRDDLLEVLKYIQQNINK